MDAKRFGLLFTLIVCVSCATKGDDGVLPVEEQLRVLAKQVKALMERRKEDLESIEDSMRRKLTMSQDFLDVREEIRSLRDEISQIRNNNPDLPSSPPVHQTRAQNDHLTVKWLKNSVAELKTEVGELQRALNASVVLQNREEFEAELELLRSDVRDLNEEREAMKSDKEAMVELTRKVDELRMELEEVARRKIQRQSSDASQTSTDDTRPHPSRHQRLLRKHITELEKTTRHLTSENTLLKSKLHELEQRITPTHPDVMEDTNEIPPNLAQLETQQASNAAALANFSRQLSNFDRLHMSMLELLENVESIEAKVDRNFPEFRKEISKLEMQLSETGSEVAMLREDQTNTRNSVKAIGVSASNLQEKMEMVVVEMRGLNETVENLKTAAGLQTAKLHDHILKSESSSLDLNSTKSTVHLVQELKSFEHEYKSIVNKLPRDCGVVPGESGLYIISPGEGEPILARCDDGWTTIQKRYDGSVDFNRSWNDYSNGFGSATGEHWLGNRNLHDLTEGNCTMLQINMRDIYGKYWQANYEYFRVEDYTDGFRLVISGYNGNASDALDYQNRMEFSTVDNDRDISNTHCASNYEGGWWFSHCQHANLNGRYNLGLTWFDSLRNEWIAVATSEMRVKRKENC